MRKKAIGIDLGTTNSAMAVVKQNTPEIIPMGANDEVVLRSAIYFSKINGKNRLFFGNSAITKGTEIGKVEYFKQDFKRDIGKNTVESEAPDHTRLNSVILSALILNEFKKRARVVSLELGLESPIIDAVITVPAYFNSDQRLATKTAGRLAGLNVLRIINEPTAAAISYAHRKGVEGNVLVYDLGGGTFDVTVMNVKNHHYDILATDGNHRLGGLDFDKRIVKLIKEKLESQGVNMSMLTPKEEMQLRYQAEKIKIDLSVNPVSYYELVRDEEEFGIEITQEEFKYETQDLLKDTQIKVISTLQEANMTWQSIDHILLVGGSTRMPIVRNLLREMSQGIEPKFDLNPDTIVAEGASIIADLIVNNEVSFNELNDSKEIVTDKVIIKDVTSQGIGLLYKKRPTVHYPFGGDFYNSIVVPRNTVLPFSMEKTTLAVADGQSKFKLRITEGNSENPLNNKIIGEEIISLEHPRRKGQCLGIVEYSFDTEQFITIRVKDDITNNIIKVIRLNAPINSAEVVVDEDIHEFEEIFKKFVDD